MPNAGSQQPPGKGKTRRWKRTVILALLLLAGGAVVNVAVAWGCALRVRMEWHNPSGYAMSTTAAETIVFDVGEFRRRSTEPGFIRQYDLFGREWRGRGTRMLRVSRWVGYNAVAEDTGNYLIERESGLPLLSMHGQCREINDMHWAIPVPEEWSHPYNFSTWTANPTAGVFLPLKPICPGFIINTLFYALLLWLLFFALFTARRMLRRRRGLCEKCAYPIGVSPICTECGAAVRTATLH